MKRHHKTHAKLFRKIKQMSNAQLLVLEIILHVLLRARKLSRFLKNSFSRRSAFHWLGNPRPRRYERLLIPAMYIGGMLFFEGREFATWSMYAGGVASIFVVSYSVYRLIPVKKYHWI
jgi:hypothetical protein